MTKEAEEDKYEEKLIGSEIFLRKHSQDFLSMSSCFEKPL